MRNARSLLWLAMFAAIPAAHAGGPIKQAVDPLAAMLDTTDRFIVTVAGDRADVQGGGKSAAVKQMESAMTATAGQAVTYFREMSGGQTVFKLTKSVSLAEANKISRDWMAKGLVVTAEPDARMVPMAAATDPLASQQWALKPASQFGGGANAEAAWDLATGKDVTVAVLDTGILPHADLAGQVLPGYDFITDTCTANDGDGRDADPTDPGNWIELGDCLKPSESQVRDSNWHGTHVAGIIAAKANNGAGIAGIAPNAKILPLRVLGKGGGYTSDIVDAMRWAAGIPVTGTPSNPNPAKVLNLSLGGAQACSSSSAYTKAIADVNAKGAVVVVAAGNANAKVRFYSPASCPGALTVHAHGRAGHDAYYSNIGPQNAISGPGGDFIEGYGVLSTLDGGKKQALKDNAYAEYQGTSMATPAVAGVIALMLERNPGLTPAQIRTMLQQTARPFVGNNPDPTLTSCTTALCGAGLVDAYNAVLAASGVTPSSKPSCTATASPAVAAPGQQVTVTWATGGDSDGQIELTTNGSPQGMVSASGNAATLALFAGQYTWTFTAANGNGTTSCSATFTVGQ